MPSKERIPNGINFKIPQHNDINNILPENAGIIILSMKALVSRNNSVEQTLAGVEATQALNQPSVA